MNSWHIIWDIYLIKWSRMVSPVHPHHDTKNDFSSQAACLCVQDLCISERFDDILWFLRSVVCGTSPSTPQRGQGSHRLFAGRRHQHLCTSLWQLCLKTQIRPRCFCRWFVWKGSDRKRRAAARKSQDARIWKRLMGVH